MKIALVSTSAVAVPPKGYGGTELVVAELAKTLVKRGHDVTVFATGDSTCEGRLLSRFDHAIWPPDAEAEREHARFAAGYISTHPDEFEVIHLNESSTLKLLSGRGLPLVCTLHHERVDELNAAYQACKDVFYVAISHAQAAQSPEVPFSAVVHHGLALEPFAEGDGLGGYCAFLGRLAPVKSPHLAIDAAILANTSLEIGGDAHPIDAEYFRTRVEPRIARSGGLVRHLGEVSLEPKVELLRHARALLFPIRWEEPFGLVMIEAMLVGTPVIAFPRGSAPEVVEEGVTGFLVRDVEEMAARIRSLGSFDRRLCRARARERWSSLRMTMDYERVYGDALAEGRRMTTISGVHDRVPREVIERASRIPS